MIHVTAQYLNISLACNSTIQIILVKFAALIMTHNVKIYQSQVTDILTHVIYSSNGQSQRYLLFLLVFQIISVQYETNYSTLTMREHDDKIYFCIINQIQIKSHIHNIHNIMHII